MSRSANYALGLLAVILLFSGLDRSAIAILQEDIKSEFVLTDTQLGLLNGIAYAAFYAVMGVPIARWADTGNRVTIISLATFAWSVGLAACGLAVNFVQLLSIRVLVAVGEAGNLPTSFSLIADYFPRGQRARAVAIYGLAGSFGGVVVFATGWLNELVGWRLTFMALAVPGILLALVARLTLKEPRRMDTEYADAAAPSPKLNNVFRTLSQNRTYLHLLAFMAILIFFNYGIAQWYPSFFARSFGLSTTEIGANVAIASFVGGVAGALTGGELASRFAAYNERRQLSGIALAMVMCAAASVALFLAASPAIAFLLYGLVMFCLCAVTGPLLSTLQSAVPSNMRAVAIAVTYMIANLIGMGLGPLLAGFFSDAFQPWAGEQSLRYALSILSPGYMWAAVHAWLARGSVARDLESASQPI